MTDGAWGTELQRRGLARGSCPDLWNLERPEAVECVARAYVEAGSHIILTNTFRANRVALERDPREINRAGVAISRRAARGCAQVFASIGPPGGRSTAEVSAAYAEQAEALAESGADALVIETMSNLEEAELALAAARRTGLAVIVSFAFHGSGPSPEQAARRMTEAGAGGVGANCVGIAESVGICSRLRASTSLPLWIKPSAGVPKIVDGRAVYPATPEAFASSIAALAAAGAHYIGGCCGAGPDFIRAVVRALAA